MMITLIKRSIIKIDWLLHNQNDPVYKIKVILGIIKSPTLEQIYWFNGVGSNKYNKVIDKLFEDLNKKG